jgi:hypothetical protein
LNGAPINAGVLTELSQGPQSFAFQDPNATQSASQVIMNLSEDAGQGDAQFSVSIDGQAASAPQTVTAVHSAGNSQSFDLSAMGPGAHDVAVSFLNAAPERALYVGGITVGSTPVPGASGILTTNSTLHFLVNIPSS